MESRLWFDEFDAFLQKQVAADKFSGCVLVARAETPIFRKAYGLASKRFNVPNQIDTKFNLGSINKVFTKVAVMQLFEQHKLSLEDYVSKHLPNYPSDVASKVKINHLLNHTSGMGNYFNEKFEASQHKLRTVDDFLSLFINDPLSFKPGEKIQYSNAGYVVLGRIIESVSGQNYYDYVREHIYKPAGMKDSDHYEMDMPTPNLAIGYTEIDEEGQPSLDEIFALKPEVLEGIESGEEEEEDASGKKGQKKKKKNKHVQIEYDPDRDVVIVTKKHKRSAGWEEW